MGFAPGKRLGYPGILPLLLWSRGWIFPGVAQGKPFIQWRIVAQARGQLNRSQNPTASCPPPLHHSRTGQEKQAKSKNKAGHRSVFA